MSSQKEQLKKRQERNRRLLTTYGLTLDEYEEKLKRQGEGCFICGTKKRLNVDHRHIPKFKSLSSEDKKKEVRGILCFRHNKFTIGGLEIDKDARHTLNKVIEYFALYKIKGDK